MEDSGAALEAIDQALLREISAQGGMRRFPANAILIHEGDTADSLYIVVTGRVKVYSMNAEGRAVVITTHGPGEYVGEMSLDGGARSASVMALEPTACSVVPGSALRGFIAEHPDFALHLIRKLIRRVRHATESVKSLALDDVYGRVVRLLLEQSIEEGGQRVVHGPLTQQDIAERVGASREMVNRIFKELIAGGYIAVAARRVAILKKLPAAW